MIHARGARIGRPQRSPRPRHRFRQEPCDTMQAKSLLQSKADDPTWCASIDLSRVLSRRRHYRRHGLDAKSANGRAVAGRFFFGNVRAMVAIYGRSAGARIMRRGQGSRLPIPTHDEFNNTVIGHNPILGDTEIVACAGRREGKFGALSMALSNGLTATVCVDLLSAVIIVATLKEMFPNCDKSVASPAIVTQVDNGIGVQAGHQSGE